MEFCKYCGSQIDGNPVFCSRCGKRLRGSSPQKSTMKFVIPAALAAFIVAMLILNSISKHSVSKKDEFYENIGDSVIAVLSAITGRPDYIYGDFEPLIGVTDENENGCAEILAVYETKNGDTCEVRCDVWRADATGADELLSDVLFTEAGGGSGKLHMTRAFTENYYAYYVMFEQNETIGEHFKNSYAFYMLSYDETALFYSRTFVTEGRYDTEHDGIADADYYINTGKIPENPVSADNFNALLNCYSPIYTLDIISGEYDCDKIFSFDWAWKAFQAS